jgi:hypothetical protein
MALNDDASDAPRGLIQAGDAHCARPARLERRGEPRQRIGHALASAPANSAPSAITSASAAMVS